MFSTRVARCRGIKIGPQPSKCKFVGLAVGFFSYGAKLYGRRNECEWNGVDGNATWTPDEWRHIRLEEGRGYLGSPNLKDSWPRLAGPQKSSYTVRIQSHLVLACLRSLTSPSPRITGPNFALSLSLSPPLSLSLSLSIYLSFFRSLSLSFFYSRPLHSQFPRKSYPRLVVDHYRQTFRVVSAVQMQRNRENGDRRFRMVVLDVWRRFSSGRFRRTIAFLFQLLEKFLLLVDAGKLRR